MGVLIFIKQKEKRNRGRSLKILYLKTISNERMKIVCKLSQVVLFYNYKFDKMMIPGIGRGPSRVVEFLHSNT